MNLQKLLCSVKDFERIKVLSSAFSKPSGFVDEAQYAATQYIAHKIRTLAKGHYDGIAYNSSKSNGGINVVIFDKEQVEFCDSELVRCYGLEYQIQNITYESNPFPNLEKEYHKSSPADIQVIKDKIIGFIKRTHP